MSDATAQKKFSCPSCGAEAQWNPGKQALVCPYCGTIAPGDDFGELRRNRLASFGVAEIDGC